MADDADTTTEPSALKEVLEGLALSQRAPKPGEGEGEEDAHAFWDTQPVPRLSEDTASLDPSMMGPIDPVDVGRVRKEPYNLPASFEWSDVDLADSAQAAELYTLLHENYVEDGDNMFRFDYSIPFLRWALQPPGSRTEWMVGVRVSSTKKLVAFISCTPAELHAHNVRIQPHHAPVGADASGASASGADAATSEGSKGEGAASSSADGKGKALDGKGKATTTAAVDVSDAPNPAAAAAAAAAEAAAAAAAAAGEAGEAEAEEGTSGAAAGLGESGLVEVNFLCVHKKLRSKRLAPVLIKEVTRRVNRLGLFQAAYTAGVVLPKPVARCRYWHRSLNPKKLIDVGFSRLAPRMTMTRTIKLYALPEQPLTRGMRPLREADCEVCSRMLNEFLKQFVISPQLSLAEFKHWLMPQAGVVSTFVVEDPETKQITDMVSFYALPSSILGNDKHTTLSAAYSYYYFHTKTPLLQLMNDALVLAKRQDFDVFNALDILHNEQYLKELKFGIGDGALQYYLFNWRCPPAAPNQVGLVLL